MKGVTTSPEVWFWEIRSDSDEKLFPHCHITCMLSLVIFSMCFFKAWLIVLAPKLPPMASTVFLELFSPKWAMAWSLVTEALAMSARTGFPVMLIFSLGNQRSIFE